MSRLRFTGIVLVAFAAGAGLSQYASASSETDRAWPVVGGSGVVSLPHADVPLENVPVPKTYVVPGKPSPTHVAQRELFHSAKGGLAIGIFESDGGFLVLKNRPTDEADYVISGTLVLHDSKSGKQTVFKAGDHLATTTGFDGIWEAKGPVRVMYFVPVAGASAQ